MTEMPRLSSVATIQLALIAGTAVVLAWITTAAVKRCAFRLGLVDVPNHRSLHARAMPCAGGLSFVVVSLSLTAVSSQLMGIQLPVGTLPLWCGSLVVAAVGLADDRWRLSA